MSIGRAEEIARTINGAIGKMIHRKPSDWDLAVSRVVYGYRRRDLVSGFSPFESLYGESSGVSFEQLSQYKADELASERRIAEVFALPSSGATHINKINSFFLSRPYFRRT